MGIYLLHSVAVCTSLIQNAFHSGYCPESLDLSTVIIAGITVLECTVYYWLSTKAVNQGNCTVVFLQYHVADLLCPAVLHITA